MYKNIDNKKKYLELSQSLIPQMIEFHMIYSMSQKVTIWNGKKNVLNSLIFHKTWCTRKVVRKNKIIQNLRLQKKMKYYQT